MHDLKLFWATWQAKLYFTRTIYSSKRWITNISIARATLVFMRIIVSRHDSSAIRRHPTTLRTILRCTMQDASNWNLLSGNTATEKQNGRRDKRVKSFQLQKLWNVMVLEHLLMLVKRRPCSLETMLDFALATLAQYQNEMFAKIYIYIYIYIWADSISNEAIMLNAIWTNDTSNLRLQSGLWRFLICLRANSKPLSQALEGALSLWT